MYNLVATNKDQAFINGCEMVHRKFSQLLETTFRSYKIYFNASIKESQLKYCSKILAVVAFTGRCHVATGITIAGLIVIN